VRYRCYIKQLKYSQSYAQILHYCQHLNNNVHFTNIHRCPIDLTATKIGLGAHNVGIINCAGAKFYFNSFEVFYFEENEKSTFGLQTSYHD